MKLKPFAFLALAVVMTAATIPSATHAVTIVGNSWRDDFDGTAVDTTFWTISNWEVGPGNHALHQGYFQPDRVTVQDGFLTLKLTQEYARRGRRNKVISRGGELTSKALYGFGTYEWRMRMGSTSSTPLGSCSAVPSECNPSGGVSAGFNYVNNGVQGITEIDFELESQFPELLEMANSDPVDGVAFATIPGMSYTFKTYKFVWLPDRIEYYVDDQLLYTASGTSLSDPAYFLMSHWGTNSTSFGGPATVGIDRYLHIDWVRFTAVGEASIPAP